MDFPTRKRLKIASFACSDCFGLPSPSPLIIRLPTPAKCPRAPPKSGYVWWWWFPYVTTHTVPMRAIVFSSNVTRILSRQCSQVRKRSKLDMICQFIVSYRGQMKILTVGSKRFWRINHCKADFCDITWAAKWPLGYDSIAFELHGQLMQAAKGLMLLIYSGLLGSVLTSCIYVTALVLHKWCYSTVVSLLITYELAMENSAIWPLVGGRVWWPGRKN